MEDSLNPNVNRFMGRDIISIEDLPKEEIDFILEKASEIENDFRNNNFLNYRKAMAGKIMISAFFEPSTRTSTSFQAAILKMGGNVIAINEDNSSRKKGETLKDTAKTIDRYNPDVVVIRHRKDGSARIFAENISAPVINAGDGKNQHPTQTLLDLYTIKELRGKIDGLKIALVGDLKYGRTVHSLALALMNYENCLVFLVAPDELKMPASLTGKLSSKLKIEERNLAELQKTIGEVDILLMTRIQRERFPDSPEGQQEYERIKSQYTLTKNMLSMAKPQKNFKIMHPLPKVDEIEPAVDKTKYAHYFKQVENGLYIREALLVLLTRGKND